MENAPAILFSGFNLPPEIEEKYNKWTEEVYLPYAVRLTQTKRIDRYFIVKKEPSYPDYVAIWYFDNLDSHYVLRDSRFRKDIFRDIDVSFSKREMVWYQSYQLMRSFGNSEDDVTWKGYSQVEDAPLIHIEGYQFNVEEQAKYLDWCMRYANSIYIPLLMKIPGVKGCDRYRLNNLPMLLKPKETTYPSFLQFLHFENQKAFENFEKSPELASFTRAMKSDISNDITPQWYVQYKLIKSFRK